MSASALIAAISNDLLSQEQVSKILVAAVESNFRAAGKALLQLKRISSWKNEGYESFDIYLKEVWLLEEKQADHLINASFICDHIESQGLEPPQNLECAIALYRVKGCGDWGEFWQKLLSSCGSTRVTPKKIYDAVKQSKKAIVTNPKHPLLGEIVTIAFTRGEYIEAETSVGEQAFVSAELCPCFR